MSTLNTLASKIEALQAEYRRTSGRNRGVIRGAVDTTDLGAEIERLQAEYNARAKRTMYSAGRIVPRSAA